MLWSFGNLVAVWYISPVLVHLNKEKSGNPVLHKKNEGNHALEPFFALWKQPSTFEGREAG
jgi:hypothetical protein